MYFGANDEPEGYMEYEPDTTCSSYDTGLTGLPQHNKDHHTIATSHPLLTPFQDPQLKSF